MSLLHASFHSNVTSNLAFATRDGYSILDLEHLEQNPFETSESSVGYIQAFSLNGTQMAAIVGSGDHAGSSPRKLKILNLTTHAVVHEISFQSTILSCAINSQYIAVCLESRIHILEVDGMKPVHKINSPTNAKGILTISNTAAPTLLGYPSSSTIGEFVITNIDTVDLPSAGVSCSAHKSRLACLQMNSSGTLIASASVTGTIIRVFGTKSSSKLYEFRRGLQCVEISSLLFCPLDALLLAGSSSGTVHIFKFPVEQPSTATAASPTSNTKPRNIVESILRAAVVSVQVELKCTTGSSRAFYIARIPRGEGPACLNITYLMGGDKRLIVVTHSGYLYRSASHPIIIIHLYFALNLCSGRILYHNPNLCFELQIPDTVIPRFTDCFGFCH
jgi:WD40 repeat protein